MFAAISAIRVPLFRMFSHFFMDAGASKRFSTSRADFINQNHLIHTERCFGVSGFIQELWIDPFGWLSRYSWLCLRCSIPRGESHVPENCTHTIRGFRHIFLATMSAPGPVRGTLQIQNIALDSDIFPESSSYLKIGHH